MAVQHKLSPRDMLLICVTVCCVLIGSSAGIKYENKCLGSTLTIPSSSLLSTGKMYFTPSDGGPRKLIMEYMKAKDPRLKVTYYSSELRDLTERDDGTFSITFLSNRAADIIRLNILDCSVKVTEYYGATYSSDVPRDAELLEFTGLHSNDQPVVLWNRTHPQTFKGGRVQVTRNGRSWTINDLTQADSGHYCFRAKNNTLRKGTQLEVKEHVSHYNAKVNDQIFIENLFGGPLWSVTFKLEEDDWIITMIERGQKVRYMDRFAGRLRVNNHDIEINPVENGDSGTFEFRDQQRNLAQTVELVVFARDDEQDEEISTAGIFGIIAANIFLMFFLCYCVRKCCCKKRSPKRREPPPRVFYHDSAQPASSSYSAAPPPYHSYQPVNPSATSLEQPVNNPVNVHVNPPQPEVAPLRDQRILHPTLGSDCLSSDPGPQFELKGMSFLTSLPLSSESSFTDVYTSDKLNFPLSSVELNGNSNDA